MHWLEVIVFYQVCIHVSWFLSTKLGLLSCTGNQVHQYPQHDAVSHVLILYCLNLEYFLWFLSSSSQQFSLVKDKNLFLVISSKYLAQGLSHSRSTTGGSSSNNSSTSSGGSSISSSTSLFYVWETRWGERSIRPPNSPTLLQNNTNIRFIMKVFV